MGKCIFSVINTFISFKGLILSHRSTDISKFTFVKALNAKSETLNWIFLLDWLSTVMLR